MSPSVDWAVLYSIARDQAAGADIGAALRGRL